MKKYVIFNKKRIILYLYLLCIMVFIFLLRIFIKDTSDTNIMGLFYALSIIYILPIFIITNSFISRYYFDDKLIRKGLILRNTIKWSNVERVEHDKDSTNIYSSKNAIKVYALNSSENEYNVIKKEILDRADKNNIPIKESIKQDASNKDNVLKLGGWLIPIFLLILISSYNGFMLFMHEISNFTNVFLSTIRIILNAVSLLFGCLVIYNYFYKRWFTIKMIKQYRWF